MATFGNTCATKSGYFGSNGLTILQSCTPTTNGVLTSVCAYLSWVNSGVTGKVKVFWYDASYPDTFRFVAEGSPQTLTAGINTFSGLNIPLNTLCVVAIYIDGAFTFYSQETGGSIVAATIAGDRSSDTLSTDFTWRPDALSILATYTPELVGGLDCSTFMWGSVGSGSTYLNPVNTITANGTITHFCWKSGGTNGHDGVKLKIFRINGTNYDFIGESSPYYLNDSGPSTGQGSCNIPVLAGDLVGISAVNIASPPGSPIGNNSENPSSPKMKMISGDIITNTAQSSWSDYDYGLLIVHCDSTGMLDVYIDASMANDTGNGQSFSTAKKYLSSGYSLIQSTGTIHAATGLYSASGITFNKNFKWSPEDPSLTGTRNAKIGP